MADIKWNLFDETKFVHLVSRLLQRLGFIDVQIQGAGPDGGIDLFATEMVAFAFQGARPVRWGIQCKFSIDGIEKAVNDSEVRDVEGILRSERYVSQRIQGYMLITNRRVTQNVVERLRGIDHRTEFHATFIDGDQLSQHLAEQPKLLEEYFSQRLEEIEKLAREQAEENQDDNKFYDVIPSHLQSTVSGVSNLEWSGDDLSGKFKSALGILELNHDTITDTIHGRYQYNDEEFVGVFRGEISGSVIEYEFNWPNKHDFNGVGFWFISPDGNALEGITFEGMKLEDLTIAEMIKKGKRMSYRRIE